MSTRPGSSNGSVTVRLHVEIYEPEQADSTRPVVVFCHGFGGSARNFRPQVRVFRKEVRFVLYDARGHARSHSPPSPSDGGTFDMATLVEDLGGVIDEYGGGKVVLGGLSMGAATALSYALGHPDRVAGLLIAAYPNPSEALRSWALAFAASIERDGLSRAGEAYVWGSSSRFDPQARTLIHQGFLEHSEAALVGLLRDCLARLTPVEDMATSLSGLRVPTRIVVGGKDADAIEPCRALTRLIPNSSLSVLEGAGHVVNLECVSEFNDELRKLISEVIK